MRFFGQTERATYLERPNRFTIRCLLKGRRVQAYLPNPGRLWELLLPGATVHLERSMSPARKLKFTAVSVMRSGNPVMLHTHRTNDVARWLIEKNIIPGFDGFRIKGKETGLSRSRIDFLIERGRDEIYLEVKSCTLFGNRVAMFPDAITERGRRHLEELAAIRGKNKRGALLFIVHTARPDYFLPEYHTDLAFSLSFLEARNMVTIIPVSVGWRRDLTPEGKIKHLKIPWGVIEREAKDRGSYLIIIRLHERKDIAIGKLGKIAFQDGYYVYVGSARKNLTSRIKRHRGLVKRQFWHIDYLREEGAFIAALPVRTADDIECTIARSMSQICNGIVSSFGASDCSCESHLFRFSENPLNTSRFHDLIQYYRMDRLVEHM